MEHLWGENEINNAKSNKGLREKIKADMEKELEIGKPRYLTPDSLDFFLKIGNRVATADAIRHFCDAVGDVNPLYRNRHYAENSVYGGLVAPPYFLCTVSPFLTKGVWDMTKYGYIIAGFDAGNEVEWFKTIRVNDEFRVCEVPIKVIDLTRENTALQFLNISKKIYSNQRDEIVAIVKPSAMKMVVSSTAQSRLKEPVLRRFSEEEISDWLQKIEHEDIRGNVPRFWEDVNVGDPLPPTHHVFTLMESAAYQSVCSSFSSWRFQLKRFGGDLLDHKLDPESGLPDLNGLHMTDESARMMGSPRANCLAGQMQAWLCSMVTNWMGDSGFLKKMSYQIRRSLYRDSLAICQGKVIKKYIEDNQHLVDLGISVQDHNGDFPIPNATATVILPSRCLNQSCKQV